MTLILSDFFLVRDEEVNHHFDRLITLSLETDPDRVFPFRLLDPMVPYTTQHPAFHSHTNQHK